MIGGLNLGSRRKKMCLSKRKLELAAEGRIYGHLYECHICQERLTVLLNRKRYGEDYWGSGYPKDLVQLIVGLDEESSDQNTAVFSRQPSGKYRVADWRD
jgi:hypothetical protein